MTLAIRIRRKWANCAECWLLCGSDRLIANRTRVNGSGKATVLPVCFVWHVVPDIAGLRHRQGASRALHS